MEVHPPDHPILTFKQFLVHMGTIVLGLLIAIALEQSVEALHHRHQLHEFREGLLEEAETNHRNNLAADKVLSGRLDWLNSRARQVQTALDTHQPLAPAAPNPILNWYYPSSATWSAARSSGLLSLFPQSDIKAYSELEDVVAHTQAAYKDYAVARRERQFFENSFTTAPSAPEDLRRYADLLRSETARLSTLRSFLRQSIGANDAIQAGERSLDRIDAAEDRVDVSD